MSVNGAITTLTNAPGTGGTTFTLATGTGAWFAAGAAIVYNASSTTPDKASIEAVTLGAPSGDSVTVTRAQQGHAALNLTSGAVLVQAITALDWDTLVALVATKLAASARGAANGVASLDSGSKVPLAQIPDLSGTYGLRPTPTVKTGAYTAAVGELVLANAATAGFTVTLPASPATGDVVWVKKTDATANVVTVVAAGKTIDGDANATIVSEDAGGEFLYDGTNWRVTAVATTVVSGGSAVTSVVGQTGAVTGTQILADSTVAAALAGKLGTTAQAADSAKVAGITVTGTPTAGQVPTATSGTAATWQTPSGGSSVVASTIVSRPTGSLQSLGTGTTTTLTWVTLEEDGLGLGLGTDRPHPLGAGLNGAVLQITASLPLNAAGAASLRVNKNGTVQHFNLSGGGTPISLTATRALPVATGDTIAIAIFCASTGTVTTDFPQFCQITRLK